MERDKKLRFLFAVWMAGGNSTIFQNLKEKIGGKEEFDSSFLPVELFPKDFIGKVPPFSLNGSLRNSAVMNNRLRSFAREGKHFSAAYYFQHTYVMFLRKYRRTVPYVMAMDGVPIWYFRNKFWYTHPVFDPSTPVSRLKHAMTRSVYAGAFHLLPLSNGVRQCLIDDYNIPPEKVTVVPPGIDLEKWKPVGRTPEPKGTESAPFHVLFVGADFLRKGGELLASLAYRPEFRNVHFHFVTKDFEGAPAPNIFVYSNLNPNTGELIDLYRKADLFALPTRADTHSIASLEAMAMSLPVVSTHTGGINDIIDDGVTGFFVPNDDAEAIASKIRLCLASPGRTIEMGAAGRKRVEERFNLDRHVEFICDLMIRAAASARR